MQHLIQSYFISRKKCSSDVAIGSARLMSAIKKTYRQKNTFNTTNTIKIRLKFIVKFVHQQICIDSRVNVKSLKNIGIHSNKKNIQIVHCQQESNVSRSTFSPKRIILVD